MINGTTSLRVEIIRFQERTSGRLKPLEPLVWIQQPLEIPPALHCKA